MVKATKSKSRQKIVHVKASKSHYRKATSVSGFNRTYSRSVKNKPHTRRPRRTKSQIARWGTRKNPKYPKKK